MIPANTTPSHPVSSLFPSELVGGEVLADGALKAPNLHTRPLQHPHHHDCRCGKKNAAGRCSSAGGVGETTATSTSASSLSSAGQARCCCSSAPATAATATPTCLCSPPSPVHHPGAAIHPPPLLRHYDDIKEKLLKRFRIFLFDMDGVLWEGENVIRGAIEALMELKKQGKRIYFITNNSLFTTQQYVALLHERGFGNISPDQIYCASSAVVRYLEEKRVHAKIYLIGNESFREELSRTDGIEVFDNSAHNAFQPHPLEMAEVDVDESIDGVVMGFDPKINYYKVAYAAMLLNQSNERSRNRFFIVTNMDKQYPAARNKKLPGAGSFISALEIASRRTPYIVGKPGSFIIEDILRKEQLREQEDTHQPRPDASTTGCVQEKSVGADFSVFSTSLKDEMVMIGDNLYTDIMFGKLNGIATLLVETGVNTIQEAALEENRERRPDFVIPSIALFVPPST